MSGTPEASADVAVVGGGITGCAALAYLAEAGLPLTFALRSAGSTTLQPTDPVTLGFILNRFNIQVPEKFTFGVEPAIRSIRELSLGDRIQLRDTEPTAVPEGEEGAAEGEGEG